MNKPFRLLMLGILMLVLVLSASPMVVKVADAAVGDLRVHMVNVDGAGFIVQLPNGKNMVVDAGVGGSGNTTIFFNKLDSLGITKIDYLVATHQHSDHIGNFNNIINNYNIGTIIFPGGDAPHNNTDFTYMKNAADNKGISITYKREGQAIFADTTANGKDLTTYIFAPIASGDYGYTDGTENVNSLSLVFNVKYGSTGILFAADALNKTLGEFQGQTNSLLKYDPGTTTRKYPLSNMQVMTAGHHGANGGSNPAEFLKSVPALTHMLIPNKNEPLTTTSIYAFKERLKDSVYNPAIAFWTTWTNADVLIESNGTAWSFPETPEWQP